MNENQLRSKFKKDRMTVGIYESRLALSQAAAEDVAETMGRLLAEQETISMIFAPAASATDFLAALVAKEGIEWERVYGFHLDEYVGKNMQRISAFAQQQVFGKVPFKQVFFMNGDVEDVHAECERYGGLLRQYGTDIACIGIGENGHLAYNEPHVADFQDPHLVKPITLDEVSRRQAVKDRTFATLEEVPLMALTMTMPAICSAKHIFTVVPDERKNRAVRDTLEGPITTDCPASWLRNCPQARLYLDRDSAGLLSAETSA